jgi:glycosyltransferase involved in cell wall biosynthesis
MHRVAVVASHPIQYQAPWFRALARVVDLEVFYCHRQSAAGQAKAGFGVPFEWDVPLLDGYRFTWLKNISASPGVSRFQEADTPEIADRLKLGGFDACLVSGWYLKSYVQAIRACWKHAIPVLVRGDSQLNTPRSRARAVAKYLPYRWFLRRIDAHLYVGAANAAYLRSYGVPDERLFFTPHFVDNEFFAVRASQARRDGTRDRIRRDLGAGPDSVVFLFVGKLIDKKRPADFIRAIERAASSGRREILGAVVGSGPLGPEIESLARERQIPITFLGFKNQTDLPACYAAADAIVLPSDGGETWGLVVNEAMACGVPALVSASAGCAADLVVTAKTGFTFPLGDVAALEDRMIQLSQLLKVNRAQVEADVAARICEYSVDAAVDGVLRALVQVAHPASTREVVA